MALQIWLPLISDLKNQGLANSTSFGTTTAFATSGKIGSKSLYSNAQKTATFAELANLTNFSFAYWIKIDSSIAIASWADIIGLECVAGSSTTIIRDEFTSTVGCHQILMGKDSTVGSNTNTYYGTGATATGAKDVWTHYVIIKNNTNTYVYTNGILTNTLTNTNFEISPQKLTGKIYLGNTGSTAAQVNDFRIYDHCLSPMEVKQLAQGLVLHYPLDRGGWGQENLYTGSRDFSGTWVNGSAWSTSTETYEGFTVKQKSTVWGGLAQNVTCSSGDVFTVSFYAKVTSGGNILSIHRSSLGNVTTGLTILGGNFSSSTNWVNTGEDGTQWKRYWATVRIDSSDITYLQWRIENSVADKTLYVCGMKLEKGSIATPWCPNSSDTFATTMGLNGTTEYDCSGYCNNGTRVGTLTYTSNTPKYMVSTHTTNGNTGRINSPSLSFPSNAVTLNVWFRSTNTSPTGDYHMVIDSVANRQWYEMAVHKSGYFRAGLFVNGTRYADNGTSTTILNGNWHMLTLTYDGITIKRYVDAVMEKSTAITASSGLSTPTAITIGRDGPSNSYGCVDADISDVRIYATALSADDVKSLYQNSAYIDSSGNVYGAVHSEV